MAIPFKPKKSHRVWKNDTDWWIAGSKEEAQELCDKYYCGDNDPEEDGEFVRVPGEEIIKVGFDDEGDVKISLQEAESQGANISMADIEQSARADRWMAGSPGIVRIVATAEWWAQLGPGMLCSTER